MYKLYYDYIVPPRKIILKSKALQLTHEINQSDWDIKRYNNNYLIGIDDLFILAGTGLFTELKCLVDEDMIIYFFRKSERINVHGWIDITKFGRGGQVNSADLLHRKDP